MTFIEAFVCLGVIFLFFAMLAGIAELIEKYEDRELNRRFRENQRLRREVR
jgi:hypothetical protein